MFKSDVTLGFVLYSDTDTEEGREKQSKSTTSLGVVHPGPSGGLPGSLQVLLVVVAATVLQTPGSPPPRPRQVAPPWTAACSTVP